MAMASCRQRLSAPSSATATHPAGNLPGRGPGRKRRDDRHSLAAGQQAPSPVPVTTHQGTSNPPASDRADAKAAAAPSRADAADCGAGQEKAPVTGPVSPTGNVAANPDSPEPRTAKSGARADRSGKRMFAISLVEDSRFLGFNVPPAPSGRARLGDNAHHSVLPGAAPQRSRPGGQQRDPPGAHPHAQGDRAASALVGPSLSSA